MTHTSHKKGFTLVELLVVIGIIALLISILLPSLARARQSAQTLACLSNLRQIGLALHMYADDNQGLLPVNRDANWTWAVHVAPYLGGAFQTSSANRPRVFLCPNASMMPLGDVHYTSNPLLMPEITRNFSGNFYTRSYKLTQLRPNPAELALVFDGSQMLSRNGRAEGAAWQIDGGFMFGSPYRTSSTDPNVKIGLRNNFDEGGGWAFPPGGDIRYREQGGTAVNLLFGDGHAETFARGTVTRGNLRALQNR